MFNLGFVNLSCVPNKNCSPARSPRVFLPKISMILASFSVALSACTVNLRTGPHDIHHGNHVHGLCDGHGHEGALPYSACNTANVGDCVQAANIAGYKGDAQEACKSVFGN